jgi:mannosyltransferase OCH1-like enzyme
MKIFPQTKSDLVRLALIYKHGGVYIDASVMAIQDFDWVVNMAKLPSQLILNRYGEVPSAFIFWNPFYRGYL